MGKRKSYIFAEDRRSHWLRNTVLTLLGIVLALMIALISINYSVSHKLVLDRVTVTVPELPQDLEQWSILVMGDLHGMRYGKEQSGIARLISGLNVSCIVFTGDMMDENGGIDAFMELVALLPEDKVKMYVPGDEDFDHLDGTPHASLSAKADWAVALENAGVTIVDVPVLFTRGTNGRSRIWFIPENLYSLDVDNLEKMYGQQLEKLDAKGYLTAEEAAQRRIAEYEINRAQMIRLARQEITSSDVQVALSHMPVTQSYMTNLLQWGDRSNVFALRNADLIIAGHYCGGQWRLPVKGAVYVPDLGWWPKDALLRGLDYVGGVPQYITPGLGASRVYPYLRKRVFNPPVITVVTLSSKT